MNSVKPVLVPQFHPQITHNKAERSNYESKLSLGQGINPKYKISHFKVGCSFSKLILPTLHYSVFLQNTKAYCERQLVLDYGIKKHLLTTKNNIFKKDPFSYFKSKHPTVLKLKQNIFKPQILLSYFSAKLTSSKEH